MDDPTENLTFYHGTGQAAALSILMSGVQDSLFEKYGARTLGRDMRRAISATRNFLPMRMTD